LSEENNEKNETHRFKTKTDDRPIIFGRKSLEPTNQFSKLIVWKMGLVYFGCFFSIFLDPVQLDFSQIPMLMPVTVIMPERVSEMKKITGKLMVLNLIISTLLVIDIVSE
jgi:hypothetical protein